MQITAKLVVGLSLIATAATVANALILHKQFFPSMLYITKSNASMAVIYFQAIMIVFIIFQLLKRLFFGDLRAAETEHVSERAWHAVLETCLAFTVFRDDFSPMFVMQFVMLLFIKCFHWLADDRVDVMERSPLITLKFHIRMLSVIGAMAAIDAFLVSNAYFSILSKGASSQLVFGFEYAILITMVVHVAIKYILHMHDLQTAQTWEAKAVYLLYAELVMNAARCLLYGMFALIMMRLHTFPLFSIRPFYLSVRALHKAFNDVILSRRAIAAMNTMFPVVNDTELANMDSTCIICREEMTAESQPKRLPCSHVFHAHCLRSWFQRQQTCPTCRTDILAVRPNNDQPQQAAAQQQPFMPLGNPFGFQIPPQQQGEQAQQADQPNVDNPMPDMNIFGANFNMPQGNQMFPPGFPMPPFGLVPPMPPPMQAINIPEPPVLHGLSDEELHRIEGDTREAVLHRIRLLRDIATLMDAADIMMQQYMHAVNTTTTTQVFAATPQASSTPQDSNSDAATESGAAATEPTTSVNNSEEEQQTSSRTLFGSSKEASPVVDATAPVTETVEGSETADEIRQRRLRRFENTDQ